MLHVFLDSNVCFTDPFMDKNIHNRLLIELAERGLIDLYVSEVVKQEIINNFESELINYFGDIRKGENKITKLIRQHDKSPIEWKNTLEEFVLKLEDHFDELENYGWIEILPYPNEILPELVTRSIKRIKPFSDRKMEFRDAIIWFTYVGYVKDNHFIDKGYFITNNTEDFMLNGRIHPDLLRDSTDLIFYKSAQDFIQNCEEVNQLQKTLTLVKWVENEDLNNSPELILDMIHDHSFQHVFEECWDYVSKYSQRIPTNYGPDADALEVTDIQLLKVTHLKVEVVLDHVIVTGYLDVEVEFDVNMNDYIHESYHDAFVKIGSDSVILSIEFTLTVNQDMKADWLDIVQIDQV
ncbi:PIN domain-containing protein [Neobacillus sp. YIM B06451]|uniref:PIN domain-containing protein n=1 Tax=Neobacillus sp. YIM B06451 TaxID=3070994 RepID=UPI002931D971|nr:PIN domain-containing protein [Neobacillus sp. YIM B06451]